MTEAKYLSRGIDHLGDLGNKLRDLKGFTVLAHELIQNADDAANATFMSFDIRPDALIVDNDGQFSDCKSDERECPWKTDPTKHHRCDFHRFRHIFAGDKRGEEDKTGAFGMGFIAVYQITDRPELISSGRHWILYEENQENQRIEVCDGCPKCQTTNLPGTRFILPWAYDESTLRNALQVETVSKDAPQRFLAELENSLPTAMLFLKRIQRIDVLWHGEKIHCFERCLEENSIIITDGDPKNDRIWHIFSGDFSKRADELKSNHVGRIEPKRKSKINIAIPAHEIKSGFLCACLPTEHDTDLPFVINADFFPTNDRKRIILDSDYQSEWNRAAIKAAAESLSDILTKIPTLLGHKRFWSFLSQLKHVSDAVKKDNKESSFGYFWGKIEPKLKNLDIVFTSQYEWTSNADADICLLLQKEEVPVLPILESMGLNIVHEDLRPYQPLLRSDAIGIPILDIPRLCNALSKNGFDQKVNKGSFPEFIQKRDSLKILWSEIARLLGRNAGEKKKNDENSLKNIAIAPGLDGDLCPCGKIFTADPQTIQLFGSINPDIPFVSDDPDFETLKSLCPAFNEKAAINWLQKTPAEELETKWKSHQLDLNALFEWFENRRETILKDVAIKNEIAALPIFPSSGKLQTMSQVALPGDFEDPLKLSEIVDLAALGNRRDFLQMMGMTQLTFSNYVKKYITNAFKNPEISVEKRREAIKLLSRKHSEIKDDQPAKNALKTVPLIECSDENFKSANVCYFENETVKKCLGDNVHFVSFTHQKQTVSDFYIWLGVEALPRIDDLFSRIKILTKQHPSPEAVQFIHNILKYLGGHIRKSQNTEELLNESEIKDLKSMEWLPAKNKLDRWYQPEKVYASYEASLFEKSQALFLDAPSSIQDDCRKLFDIIGINKSPDARLVVEHLLFCSSKEIPINERVYKYLNDNSDKPAIRQLNGKQCLYIEGSYFAPDQVFWGEHPFGRFRKRLGDHFRDYNSLFKVLDVHETPNHEDAVKVLKELSDEFGKMNSPLDDEAERVLMGCWELIEKSIEKNELNKESFKTLQKIKCIPDRRRILNLPEMLFFENRPGLVEKFDDSLKNNVIQRHLGTWRAMFQAGVQALGSKIQIILQECPECREYPEFKQKIIERKDQIGRILDTYSENGGTEDALRILDDINYFSASYIKIKYKVHVFKRYFESEFETPPALYQLEQNQRQLIILKTDRTNWASVARELAIALLPDEDPGKIASPLKDVLSASSLDEAANTLDDLGFQRLDTTKRETIQSVETISELGVKVPMPDNFDPETPGESPDIHSPASSSGQNAQPKGNTGQEDSSSGASKGKDNDEKSQPPSEASPQINILDQFEKEFNRQGKTVLTDDYDPDSRSYFDPEKITGRRNNEAIDHIDRIENEPDPEERRKETMRTILEGADPQVRTKLVNWYGGRCQICGKTFPERTGRPFFIAKYMIPRSLAQQTDTHANALCLCADHFARWEHGARTADNIISQVKSLKLKAEGGEENHKILIKLCSEDFAIKFNEQHIIALQELISVLENQWPKERSSE
jgi:hypothetical protein